MSKCTVIRSLKKQNSSYIYFCLHKVYFPLEALHYVCYMYVGEYFENVPQLHRLQESEIKFSVLRSTI